MNNLYKNIDNRIFRIIKCSGNPNNQCNVLFYIVSQKSRYLLCLYWVQKSKKDMLPYVIVDYFIKGRNESFCTKPRN
jgi:hypothetical protein